MAETIISNILSPVIVALIGYIVWLLQQTRTDQKNAAQKQEKEAELAAKQLESISGGVCFLLRERLDIYHKRFCVRGEAMTQNDFEDVEACYRLYANLGGNGAGNKEYQELRALDIKG